jgi:dihydrolipoamide dehydrogenase
MKKYHLIVIGGGSGGLVCSAGAAGLGAKVALIEKHKMGGDCLNTGCVPSKAIIRTAKVAHDAKTASRFGLMGHDFDVKLDEVLKSVRKVQENIARHDSVERFTSLGVDVYQGEYRFISKNQITNGEEVLEAKRFVVATGGSPFVPIISGLDKVSYLTSDNVWDLKELPGNLVVIGGGPIGVELAQTFARLGSKVTLVQSAERLLVREDPEVSELIKTRFESEGIKVMLNTKAEAVDDGLATIDAKGQSQKIAFDQILLAVGRAANVEGVGLEKAGIAFDRRGIKVDEYLRTSQKHIYACGDVVGPYQFTHTADFQARLILRNALFPGKSKINYSVVPWCTFTEPEVARVGLNESEAGQSATAVDVFTYSLSDLDRAVCDRESEGFIKVLTQKGTDQILGVTLVGSHAGDLLHELTLAMHQKIGLKKVAQMIHIYPTLAEVSKRIADSYQRTRLTEGTKKLFKRYFKWRFG